MAEILRYESDTSPAVTAITPALNDTARLNGGVTPVASQTEATSNKYLYVTGSANQTETAATLVAGRQEVQTVTTLTITNGAVYSITLADTSVLTFTADGDATIAEIVAGLKLDDDPGSGTDYDAAYMTLAVATNSITLTYAASAGDVIPAVITVGGAAETVVETTKGINVANYNFGTTSAANTLALTTTETAKNVTLYVTAWLDADGDGMVDTFEKSSDRETITLYAPSAVSAVTTISDVVVGTKVVKATVAYGNDVNPFQVVGDTGLQILKDGVVVALGTGEVGTTDVFLTTIAATSQTGNLGYTKNTLVAGPDVANGNSTKILNANATAGIYSAIAFYDTTGAGTFGAAATNIRMGAPSQVLDLSAGNNADVDKMSFDVTDTANYKETATDASEIEVRAGTTTASFTVQALDATVVLKAANIDVRATVSETALDAAAEITISGSTGKLVDDGAAITAYAVTDSNGQATFTVTSKNGKALDAVDVAVEFKIASGVWTTINAAAAGGVDNGVDIKWIATAFTALTPLPAAYVSGENPTVSFKVTDQWAQPVSTISGARLSVYASAYVGGVEDTTKYAERANIVDGLATFTFANFAAAGGTAELRGILYQGASTQVATSNVTVYNTAATSALNVGTSFKTDITYNDFVTGDSSDGTVAAALTATGLGADTVRATIAGNVNNTTGAGQPGAAVTLSADGVLFFDSAAGVYALDTITVTSNEYGAWTVFAYSHTVNVKGRSRFNNFRNSKCINSVDHLLP